MPLTDQASSSMPSRGRNQLPEHRVGGALGRKRTFAEQLVDERGPLVPRQGVRNDARRTDRKSDLRKAPASVFVREPREDRQVRAVDMNRHDGRAGLVRDEAGAIVHLHQSAGRTQAAFRKDHDRRTPLHTGAKRLEQHGLRGIDRIGRHQFQKRLHPTQPRDVGVHGENGLVGQKHRKQSGIEPGRVVGNDQPPAASRIMFQAPDPNPEDGPQEEPHDGVQRGFGDEWEHGRKSAVGVSKKPDQVYAVTGVGVYCGGVTVGENKVGWKRL